MKKIMFIFAAMVALSFASCGNQTTADAEDTLAVDTVDTTEVVDTVTVDTVATDTVAE